MYFYKTIKRTLFFGAKVTFVYIFFPTASKTNGDEDVWGQLIDLINKSTSTKRSFRQSEDIYRNRIRNDVKDLDVLSSEEVKSGYHYLYSRLEFIAQLYL